MASDFKAMVEYMRSIASDIDRIVIAFMFSETIKTACKELDDYQRWLEAAWDDMKKRRDEHGEGEPGC